MHKVTNLE